MIGFPVSLALAQLRRNRGRWALLAGGVMLVVALPVWSAALARSVDAQTVRRTVSGLDLSDRTLLVNQESDSAQRHGSRAHDDAVVRQQLGTLTGRRVVREFVYRQVVVYGSPMVLTGADDLARVSRLVAGRLPLTCTPTRCEVVSVGPTQAATRRAAATLGVVVVGEVVRRSPVLVSGQLDPGRTPLLVGRGADPISRLAALSLYSSHYVWAALVDPGRVVSVGVPAWVRLSVAARLRIDQGVGGASLDAPTTALQQGAARASASSRRLGLLGGFGAALLVGFALVAAVALRREAQLLITLLIRRGATGRQVAAVTTLQAVAAGAAGALGGAVLGAVVAATATAGTGEGRAAVAGHALLGGAAAAAALAVASIAVVTAVLLWPATRERTLRRGLDLLALACLGAAVLAAGRGDASAGALAAAQDPLVVALPVLACVVAALVAARLWPPTMRAVQALLPRHAVAARVGLLGARRDSLRPLVGAGFLAAAVTAVVFAGAYRSTLLANDADQASYQVPLDTTLAASTQVLSPDVSPHAFGSGADVFGVIRGSVTVDPQPGVVDSIALLAPDDGVFSRVSRWARTTGSDVPATTLGRALTVPVPASASLPSGARTVLVRAGDVDPNTTVGLWVRAGDGRRSQVVLHPRSGPRTDSPRTDSPRTDSPRTDTVLVGTLPRSAGAATPIALTVDESFDHRSHHSHATGEGRSDVQLLSGTLRLGDVEVDGRAVAWNWTGWGSANGSVRAGATSLVLAYRIDAAPVVAVPHYAAVAGLEVPVAVDPQTARAAHNGRITLTVDSSAQVVGRVVQVMPRLPTVSGPFVLAARAPLLAALDVREPGHNATEFWVSGTSPRLRAALASTRLSVTSRAVVQADLDADPVGRGARELLILVALVGLALAAAALALLVVGERRDGSAELYAWEADGTPPSTLRRVLAVRAFAVASVGLPVGLLAGVVVARAGAALVAVGSGGTSPTPPLQVTIGAGGTVLVLVGGLGAGLLVGVLLAWSSLRERHPVPPPVELR